ncbi:caf1 family protein [Stylonychia lemnae]|uniref:poly(A)-specific ribonuclease n=1 Tax=Stylonychia lemnae TaxID=5949 RepID=A0A078APN7_STYLE|nr:caf1 family protein [Stylonychia lemnae]|eukprot:CDW83926.1 caf1 family protein [Stylonychia lemnae]
MKNTHISTSNTSPSIASNDIYHQGQVSNTQSSIKDVWIHNFFDELAVLANYIDQDYNVIAFDTEFPGILVDKNTHFKGKSMSKPFYQWIKENVDSSKVIQLGISISDEDGDQPTPVSTWQFNFQFDKNLDIYNQDSIKMLEDAGLNFVEHESNGIPHITFAEYAICSGLLLNNSLKWVAFNSAFDFGYLLKMFTSTPLPGTEQDFLKSVQTYFPIFYDVKHLRSDAKDLNSQLRNECIYREGAAHQAGSDSLVTLQLYHKSMKDPVYKQLNLPVNGKNVIYKIGDYYRRQEKERKEYYSKYNKESSRKSEVISTKKLMDDQYQQTLVQIQNLIITDQMNSQEEDPFFSNEKDEIQFAKGIRMDISAPEYQSKIQANYEESPVSSVQNSQFMNNAQMNNCQNQFFQQQFNHHQQMSIPSPQSYYYNLNLKHSMSAPVQYQAHLNQMYQYQQSNFMMTQQGQQYMNQQQRYIQFHQQQQQQYMGWNQANRHINSAPQNQMQMVNIQRQQPNQYYQQSPVNTPQPQVQVNHQIQLSPHAPMLYAAIMQNHQHLDIINNGLSHNNFNTTAKPFNPTNLGTTQLKNQN